MSWVYEGDVNVEYGGTWFNLDTWKWGYVEAVRVMDLDSGCGFRGAVMIERLTVNVGAGWSRDKRQAREVLRFCGWKVPVGKGVERKFSLASAYLSYGVYDPNDYIEVLQLEEDGLLKFDGWTAKRFDGDLKAYIEATYLD